jgi:cytochrome d ubiquinol oxidase subunit II
VAFEFRDKSQRTRGLWTAAFIGGSYICSFIQGAAIGALVTGLQISGRLYTGGAFGWLSPFAVLCGFGLCLGYALMGAGWLAAKSIGDVEDFAFRLLPRLLAAVLVFLAIAFVAALAMHLPVMHRWLTRPVLFIFPVAGVVMCALMARAIRQRRRVTPFLCSLGIFASAMGTLALSFYPYMIPFSITTLQAAAPRSSQEFLFWGAGVFVLPLTLVYTLTVYFVFKGKVALEQDGY